MNKLYTSQQIGQLYKLSAELSVSPSDLCERAAMGVVSALSRLYRGDSLIYVFAGPWACGASALAAARRLYEQGRQVRIYLVYHQGQIGELTEEKRQDLLALGVSMTEVTTQLDFPNITPGQIVLDGLFGYELEQPLSGGFAHLVRRINASGADVVSLDLPSGLFAEDNEFNDPAGIIRASHTLTFESARLAMLLSENADYIGRWEVLPLGIAPEVHHQMSSAYFTQSEELLGHLLRRRSPFTSVSDYGHTLILGGADGHYGLLSLTAEAALLAGCGEVEVRTQEQGLQIVQTLVREALVYDIARVFARWDGYTAIALSAGNHDTMTPAALSTLCHEVRRPLLLADHAIDLVAQERDLLNIIPEGSILLITPEQRARLLGVSQSHTDLYYLERAREVAHRHQLTLILQGTYTAICRSTQSVYFNTTGNAGMASRGVAQVLQGLILGFLAQGYDSLTATVLASYILGAAGDLYAARYGMESLTATRLMAQVPTILQQLQQRN